MVNASTKEALPNAFIEAGAHRCAVLAGLDPDGFASGFGYHARPAGNAVYPEVEDFERGLAWLLEQDRWRALGERAYEHVRSTFETDVAIRKHIEMYRRHLGEAPAEAVKV